MLGLSVILGFLFYYAFNNPDPQKCYYIPGMDTPFNDKAKALDMAQQLKVKVSDEYPVNMASVFRIWFSMGFFVILNYMALIVQAAT